MFKKQAQWQKILDYYPQKRYDYLTQVVNSGFKKDYQTLLNSKQLQNNEDLIIQWLQRLDNALITFNKNISPNMQQLLSGRRQQIYAAKNFVQIRKKNKKKQSQNVSKNPYKQKIQQQTRAKLMIQLKQKAQQKYIERMKQFQKQIRIQTEKQYNKKLSNIQKQFNKQKARLLQKKTQTQRQYELLKQKINRKQSTQIQIQNEMQKLAKQLKQSDSLLRQTQRQNQKDKQLLKELEAKVIENRIREKAIIQKQKATQMQRQKVKQQLQRIYLKQNKKKQSLYQAGIQTENKNNTFYKTYDIIFEPTRENLRNTQIQTSNKRQIFEKTPYINVEPKQKDMKDAGNQTVNKRQVFDRTQKIDVEPTRKNMKDANNQTNNQKQTLEKTQKINVEPIKKDMRDVDNQTQNQRQIFQRTQYINVEPRKKNIRDAENQTKNQRQIFERIQQIDVEPTRKNMRDANNQTRNQKQILERTQNINIQPIKKLKNYEIQNQYFLTIAKNIQQQQIRRMNMYQQQDDYQDDPLIRDNRQNQNQIQRFSDADFKLLYGGLNTLQDKPQIPKSRVVIQQRKSYQGMKRQPVQESNLLGDEQWMVVPSQPKNTPDLIKLTDSKKPRAPRKPSAIVITQNNPQALGQQIQKVRKRIQDSVAVQQNVVQKQRRQPLINLPRQFQVTRQIAERIQVYKRRLQILTADLFQDLGLLNQIYNTYGMMINANPEWKQNYINAIRQSQFVIKQYESDLEYLKRAYRSYQQQTGIPVQTNQYQTNHKGSPGQTSFKSIPFNNSTPDIFDNTLYLSPIDQQLFQQTPLNRTSTKRTPNAGWDELNFKTIQKQKQNEISYQNGPRQLFPQTSNKRPSYATPIQGRKRVKQDFIFSSQKSNNGIVQESFQSIPYQRFQNQIQNGMLINSRMNRYSLQYQSSKKSK